MRAPARIAAGLAAVALLAGPVARPMAQQPGSTLADLIATERAFAARALVVGWKQAFLEYFAEDAIAFDASGVIPAVAEVSAAADPPPDLELIWEPRSGDVAASGDLGYLTGPVVTRRAAAAPGQATFGNYASVWRREADGTFRVVADVGITTPDAPAFAPGFTRALGDENRWRGGPEGAGAGLAAADAALDAAATRAMPEAYAGRLHPGVRLHEPDRMPAVGAAAVGARLAARGAWATAGPLGSAVSAAGDLGYAWGAYAARETPDRGHYVRVWARRADGAWALALEVLQPAPAP